MHAVVSLLDDGYAKQVQALWAELYREFGVRGIFGSSYPHFSYQVAASYDVKRLAEALEPVANATAPFRIHTGGLGIFPGPRPVLFVPVVRSARLSRLQQALWRPMTGVATDVQGYYQPSFWMPHITIGYGDMDPEMLGRVVTHLSTRSFAWEIPIDNLAVIYERDGTQGVEFRLAFGGRKRRK
ncbi:MAG: hypothetical protein JWN15_1862 [Firmicutes bacterium]|nr:hypothetical protein [Bacillota bacterium]